MLLLNINHFFFRKFATISGVTAVSSGTLSSPSQQLPPPHPRLYLFILHSTIKIKFLIGSPNYRATQQNKTTSIRIIGKDACPWNVCCRHGYYYCPPPPQRPRKTCTLEYMSQWSFLETFPLISPWRLLG